MSLTGNNMIDGDPGISLGSPNYHPVGTIPCTECCGVGHFFPDEGEQEDCLLCEGTGIIPYEESFFDAADRLYDESREDR